MRLVCPSCSATYRVDAASVGGQGRMVRCANCGAEWFQAPAITDESLNPPLSPAAEEPTPAAPAQEDHGRHHVAAQPAREAAYDYGGAQQEPQAPPAPSQGYDEPVYDVSAGQARPSDYSPVYYEEEPLQQQPAFITPSQTHIEEPRLEADARPPERAEAEQPRGGGGFLAGFSTVVVLAVVAAGVYVKAPALAEVAPTAAPALASYVEMVDQGRAALAALIG